MKAAAKSPRERCFIQYRQRYLPAQLEATRRKLEALRREALRLGMPELVIADDRAELVMRQESIALQASLEARAKGKTS